MIWFLILISAFSLPFTQAMTIDIKFPLKIYEVALILAGLLLLLKGKISIAPGAKRNLQILMAFCGLVTLLVLMRIALPAEGMNKDILDSRFGPAGDGITKLVYLFLAVLGFTLFAHYTFKDQNSILKAWLAGAVVASLYTWYLFIVSAVGGEPFLLPGLESPSWAYFSSFSAIRSGTFREGNFMGLYILLSTAIALFARRYKTALFLSLTIIVTVSTINLMGLMLFWGLVIYHRLSLLKIQKKIPFLILCITILLITTVASQNNEYVQNVLTKKLFGDPESFDSISRMDRTDLALRGLDMFKDNIFMGVGLSQYGYYHKYYESSERFSLQYDNKTIANNIYIELLAETGIFGFLLFMFFLFSIYSHARTSGLESLKYGFIAMLFGFLAYPTFSIMFLWAFWGVIVGVSANASLKSKNVLCSNCDVVGRRL